MRKFFVRPDMRRDEGLSMPELTVTMLVMSVVLAGLATLFIGSLNTAVGTQARLEEVSDARIAVSSMGRTLRTAILPSQLYDSASTASAAFIQAEPRAISFYANVDNVNNAVGPTRVRYWIDSAGVLYESKQVPTPVHRVSPGSTTARRAGLRDADPEADRPRGPERVDADLHVLRPAGEPAHRFHADRHADGAGRRDRHRAHRPASAGRGKRFHVHAARGAAEPRRRRAGRGLTWTG